MRFIKRLLLYVFSIVFSIVLLAFIAFSILKASFSSDTVKISPNSVLLLKFDKPVEELSIDNPFNLDAIDFSDYNRTIGLHDLKNTIDHAKNDPSIRGILLYMDYFKGGYASLEDVKNSLKDFKKSGKFIYSYSDFLEEKAYYITSLSDTIILNPTGIIELNGITSTKTFFKGTLDKLGIKAKIFRVGDYKSAVEVFNQKKPSKESIMQTQIYIDSLNDYFLRTISHNRDIEYTKIKNVSDSMLVRNSVDAINYKLINDTGYYETIINHIKSRINVSSEKDFNLVDYSIYRKSIRKDELIKDRIAVVVAEGEITLNNKNEISARRMTKLLRKLRNDDNIKAVVLRINSPGGSLIGSEMIWKEVSLLSSSKSVVASMGDVAASGGYYIALGCDTIVANPNTLTGSIGIFGIVFELSDAMNKKLGITFENVNTGFFSDFLYPTRDVTKEEEGIIQKSIEEGYQSFLNRVSMARNMSLEDAKNSASGRVFIASEAKERNLIDYIGDIDKAILLAASNASIDDYTLEFYPKKGNFFDQLKEELISTSLSYLGIYEKEKWLKYIVKEIDNLKRIQGKPQARIPYTIKLD